MIKIKAFPVENYEEANAFIKDNPPRSTEKQSGMIFHNGNIVIIYDDGFENPVDREGTIKTLLEGARQKLWLVEHQLETAKLALEELAPKDFEPKLSSSKLKELVKEEMPDAEYKDIESRVNQIENAENTLTMDLHEYKRIEREIKAYENLLVKLIPTNG